MQVDHFLTICRTFQTTLSCMWLTHALFSLKILICTDTLYLCKLLGFSVTPKSVFFNLNCSKRWSKPSSACCLTFSSVLRSLRSWRLSEIKRCGVWKYSEFSLVRVQIYIKAPGIIGKLNIITKYFFQI